MYDLTFFSNVNLTKNCGVEQSLNERYNHNTIYGTLNFNMYLPPPYYRELLDYKSDNTECIQNSNNKIDWARALENENCNKQCKILSETLLNILRNFISHKVKK